MKRSLRHPPFPYVITTDTVYLSHRNSYKIKP
jgi:hypothetical protein